jgi:hypothetical protein
VLFAPAFGHVIGACEGIVNSIAAVSCAVGDAAATVALVDRAIEAVSRLIVPIVGDTESVASAREPVARAPSLSCAASHASSAAPGVSSDAWGWSPVQ